MKNISKKETDPVKGLDNLHYLCAPPNCLTQIFIPCTSQNDGKILRERNYGSVHHINKNIKEYLLRERGDER